MATAGALNAAEYEQAAMPLFPNGQEGPVARQQLTVSGQSLPVDSGDVLINYAYVGTAPQQSVVSTAPASFAASSDSASPAPAGPAMAGAAFAMDAGGPLAPLRHRPG
jgi:hypothetical protein